MYWLFSDSWQCICTNETIGHVLDIEQPRFGRPQCTCLWCGIFVSTRVMSRKYGAVKQKMVLNFIDVLSALLYGFSPD